MTCVRAYAESYQVDLIVFATGGGNGEQGRSAFLPESARVLGDQDPAGLRDYGLKVLPEANSGLNDLWQKLTAGRRYTPLARITFVQSNPQEGRGPALRVAAGNMVDNGLNSFHSLDGSVALRGGRSLELDADLAWTVRSNDGSVSSWVLNENRKLKLNELNYLDSARLGVIAKVTKAAN